jgi:hypothetical protein
MLRASILHFDKSWDKCLSLAEFSYNNSYQASLKMAPFDALYGRRCRTPLNWSETGERTLFGPDLVKDADEKVQVIRENLKMAQMRQKSHHDKGTSPRLLTPKIGTRKRLTCGPNLAEEHHLAEGFPKSIR